MAERTAVQCAACGHSYSARLVGDEVVVPTDDGRCVCGSDAFERVESIADSETAADGDPAGAALVCDRCGEEVTASSFEPVSRCGNCGGTRFHPAGDG